MIDQTSNIFGRRPATTDPLLLHTPPAAAAVAAHPLAQQVSSEPLLRIYAEAASPELVEEILATSEKFVHSA